MISTSIVERLEMLTDSQRQLYSSCGHICTTAHKHTFTGAHAHTHTHTHTHTHSLLHLCIQVQVSAPNGRLFAPVSWHMYLGGQVPGVLPAMPAGNKRGSGAKHRRRQGSPAAGERGGGGRALSPRIYQMRSNEPPGPEQSPCSPLQIAAGSKGRL